MLFLPALLAAALAAPQAADQAPAGQAPPVKPFTVEHTKKEIEIDVERQEG